MLSVKPFSSQDFYFSEVQDTEEVIVLRLLKENFGLLRWSVLTGA